LNPCGGIGVADIIETSVGQVLRISKRDDLYVRGVYQELASYWYPVVCRDLVAVDRNHQSVWYTEKPIGRYKSGILDKESQVLHERSMRSIRVSSGIHRNR
jgi:hypothetical protein